MTTYKNIDIAFRILAKTKTLDKQTVLLVLEKYGEVITDIMLENSKAKLDNWGVYIPVTRKSRKMRPFGNEERLVPEAKTIIFKPTKNIKKILNSHENSQTHYVIDTAAPNEQQV
ncbi:MAG: HU family DNA-binding protein [Candidatus Parvarchaeum sp.]